MFPVLVRIDNREGLLKPGMNTDVEIHVGRRGQRAGGARTPLSAPRRTSRSAAQVLGLIAGGRPAAAGRHGDSGGAKAIDQRAGRRDGGAGQRPGGAAQAKPGRQHDDHPRRPRRSRCRPASPRRRSGPSSPSSNGGQPTPAERAILQQLLQAGGGGRRGGGGWSGRRRRRAGQQRLPVRRRLHRVRACGTASRSPVNDHDRAHRPRLQRGHSRASARRDSVLVLPSASLVQSQQEFKQRMQQHDRRRRSRA